MDKIIFTHEPHVYRRESDGCRLMSGTHISKLFDTTDWVHNVRKSAAKRYLKPTKYEKLKKPWEKNGGSILDPKFIDYLMPHMHEETFNRLCVEVKAEWRGEGARTSEIGTNKHAEHENEAITSGFSINPANGLSYPTQPHGKTDWGNTNIHDCLCDYEPGFYTEVLLWYFFPEKVFSDSLEENICGICGTADKAYIEPNCVYLGDYKFPKKPLDDFAYEYPNHGYEMHSYPWDDIKKTRTSGYRIQLNIYGWICEQHGLPPKDLRIHSHGKDIRVRYEGDRVEKAVHKIMMEGL